MKPACRIIQTKEEMEMAKAIRLEVFVRGQNVPIEHEMDELDAKATHVLCYFDGRPAGTGRLVRLPDNEVKLGRVAVLEEFRGKHIGQAIMLKLKEEAEKNGPVKIWGNAQLWTTAFYEKLGFVAEGDVFVEAGIDHVKMVWLNEFIQ